MRPLLSRQVCTAVVSVVVGFGAVTPADAETIWDFTHEASGEGWANVFDGGPPVQDSVVSTSPDDISVRFFANDSTLNTAVMRAGASASGQSFIGIEGDVLFVSLDLGVTYTPSFHPDGDRPGGASEGSFVSVIEFAMPADVLDWTILQLVQLTDYYSGTSTVVVENVSTGQELITLTEQDQHVGLEHMTLTGHQGDVIRISSDMSGQGSVPAGLAGPRRFDTDTEFIFTVVPEPGTFVLLTLGAVLFGRRGGG